MSCKAIAKYSNDEVGETRQHGVNRAGVQALKNDQNMSFGRPQRSRSNCL